LSARGAARKGFEAYRYQVQFVLRLAECVVGQPVSIPELFANEALLGRVVVDDRGVDGRQLSRWTVAQRRSAVRSVATLLRPELMASIGVDPHVRLDDALRRVAERVGSGYRLTGGAPRLRGGATPSMAQVVAIIDNASAEDGFAGARNAAFFSILASTGVRVNALRQLSCSDCVKVPSGRIRIFVHEKGKSKSRELELSHDESAALHTYADAYNTCAGVYEWSGRFHLGSPGLLWRGVGGHGWTYRDITATLARACEQANVGRLTPHAFRRAFASTAATVLPRHVVALAGGWQGLERLDNHYVHVAPDDVLRRLAAIRVLTGSPRTTETDVQETLHATA